MLHAVLVLVQLDLLVGTLMKELIKIGKTHCLGT